MQGTFYPSRKLRLATCTLVLAAIFFAIFVPGISAANAAQVPTILSYQGRLTDSSGTLLGGSGTTYYFKFSIWDSPTVGSGSRIWPASAPTSNAHTVRQGVFNVNIGDTGNGYPDTLDIDFSKYTNLYLQVEVSTDNATFETLAPRQQVTSVPFAHVAGQVSGVGQSTFGTLTPDSGSVVTIAATTTNATPLSIRGIVGQLADLFTIKNSVGTRLFGIGADGSVNASSTLAVSGIAHLYDSLFVDHGLTVGGTTVLSTTTISDLTVNSLAFGNSTGILRATAGVISSGLVNLASDVSGVLGTGNGGTGIASTPAYGNLLVGTGSGYALAATSTLGIALSDTTGTLAQGRGGTGIASYAAGDLLYADLSGNLSRLPIGGPGQVLKASSGGLPVWGSSATAASSSIIAIYPLQYDSNTGVLGLDFGTTTSNTWAGTQTFGNLIAANATTTSFSIGGDYLTSLTGSGLTVSGSALTLDRTGDWTGTFDGQTGSYYLLNSFSTTSAAYFLSTKNTDSLAQGITNRYYSDTLARGAFSSTATGLSYDNTSGIFSLTSGYSIPLTASSTEWNAAYVNRITSASAPLSLSSNILSLSQASASTDGYLSSTDFSTFSNFNSRLSTSTLALFDKGFFFSTTSADYWKAQNNFYSTTSANYWLTTKSTDDLTEGSNLYFTLNHFASALAGTTTDALKQGTINRYYDDSLARGAFSSAATGLTYTSGTGVFSLTSGYAIPLVASTTDWNSAYVNRITSASAPLSITSNVLSIAQSSSSLNGYLSSTDWSTFNNKVSSTSLSALYPLQYNSSTGAFNLAFGTSTSNTFGGTQTFTNAPVLGALTGILYGNGGVLASAATSTPSLGLGLTYSGTLGAFVGGTGGTLAISTTSFSGSGSNLNADFIDGLDSTVLFANSFSSTSAAYYLSQNQGGAYSTTSANYWKSQNNFYSTTSADYWLTTKTSDNLTQGTVNKYYSDTLAHGAFSSTATGLTYTSASGVFSLTSGYSIPLTASTTDWNTAYLNRITSASAPLSLSGNILSLSQSSASSDGYLSSTDYSNFNNRLSTTTISLFDKGFFFSTTSANYFLAQNQGASYSTTSANYWLTTKSTTNLAEGSNLYFTTNHFASALAGTTTDALAQGGTNKYYSDTLARGAFSSTATGLTYNNSTGIFSLTGGYSIPLTASTTDWNTAYLNRITSASSPLSISNNVLSLAQSSASLNGYLSSADWNTFNNKISSTSLSALYPLQYNSGSGVFNLAFGTTTSNTFGGTQTFTNAPVLGALTGVIYGNGGALAASATSTPTLGLGLTYSGTLGAFVGGAGGTLAISTTSFSGSGSNFSADYLDNLDSTYFLANSFSSTSAAYFLSQNQGVSYSTTSANYWLTTKTTDNLTQGTVNKYYSDTLARGAFSSTATGLTYTSGSGIFSLTAGYSIPLTASTTDWNTAYLNRITSASAPLSITSHVLSISQATGSTDGYLSATDYADFNSRLSTTSLALLDKGFFFSTTSANYWKTQNNFYSTTSADYWLTTKSTSNLTEGSNLYFTTNHFASALAGTTTDALAQGITNKYYSDTLATANFVANLAATTSVNSITALSNLATVKTTLSGLIKASSGVLATAVSGTDYAPATSGSSILYGNSAGGFSNVVIGSGLTFVGGTLATSGSGITAIGPVGQTQTGGTITFASSTAGTDFSITGAGNTLTFNLPTASASNRGLLTSSDFTAFNSKQTALTFSYPLVNSANTVSLAFGTTTANSWSALQTFNGGVTVTGASNLAAATTTSLFSTSHLTNTFAAGQTGTTTINSAGALSTPALTVGTLSGLLYGTSGVVGAANVNSPLSFTGGALSINNAAADGSTLGAAAFNANDFNAASGVITLDYTNGQKASGSQPGFLASTDFTTFNNKVGTTRAINTTYPLQGGGDLSADRTLTLAFGTTTSNTFGGTQTFTNAPVLGTLTGLVGSNNGVLYQIASSTNFVTSVAAGTGIGVSGSTGAVTISNNGLLTLAQTYGSAQTGAITFATSSATSFNGLTVSHTITNTGGAFTFGTPTISGTLNNAGLANSSVSLGGVSVSLGASVAQPAFDLTNATNLPITSGTTGTLTVVRGGTGWATIQSGALLYGNGGSALATTTAGTNGQVLALLGGIPTWTATTTAGTGLTYSAGAFSVNTSQNIAKLSNLTANGFVKTTGGDGTLTIDTSTYLTSALTSIGPAGQTQVGPAITFASSTTGTDFTVTGAGNTITFNLPTASASNRGLLASSDFTTFNSKQAALTFAYPLVNSANTVSLAFGTTTANTWSALQTFNGGITTAGTVTLGSLNGVLYGNNGIVASVATSSYTVGSEFSYSGTFGSFVGGANGSLSLSTNGTAFSKLVQAGANTLLGNPTGAAGNVQAFATSSLGIALSDTSGTLGVARGGTGSTTLTGILKGNGTGIVQTAVGNTDYQLPITLTTTGTSGASTFNGTTLNIPQYTGTIYTATYPITLAGNAFGLAFGTSTSNTWGGTQTFTNTPVLGALTGLVAANNGALYQIATSTSFVTSLSAGTGIGITGATGAVTISNNGLLSLAQTYGSAQVGAVTIATSSAAASNGITVGLNITNSSGAFTFTPTVSVANIPNAALQNSTISSIALGGTLGALSATNSTLTFSGSYTGAAAQTIGINLANANVWSGLQSFANASSTLISNTGKAYFGGTATTTIDSAGNVVIPATASLTIGSATGLDYRNAGVVSTATVNSPLSFSAGTLSIGNAIADGSTKGAAAFTAADFNDASGVISLDYTNGQKATGSVPGFLAAADFTTFSGKVSTTRAINTTYPLQGGGDLSADRTLTLAFGTTTSNTFAGTQTFTNAPVLGTLTGLVGSNNGTLYQIATSTSFVTSAVAGTGIGVSGSTGAVTISNTGLLSLAQTYGSAQTGAITFATSSATSFNGLTVSHTITNTAGAFTFGTPTISGTLNNAGLANSSVSLGGVSVSLGASVAQPAFDLTNATNLPITTGTTGTLTVARGGTGWATIQSGALLYGNGGSALATTTAGTNGQVLTLAGGIPTWTATTTAGTGLSYAAGAFSVNTSQNISTLSNLTSNGLVKTSGGTGALSIASAGTDYQAPITLTTTGSSGAATFISNTLNIPQYTGTTYTATYPVTLAGSTFGLAFGTTTSNTWAGTQTFTNTPVLGTLSGLVGSNNGTLYQIATSSSFVTSVAAGTGIGLSGSTGAVTISNNGLLSLAQTYGSAQTGAITIASSTTGTDFSITNSSGAFTFNLPTASASNRGLLSSADFTTFNSKQAALTFTYPLVNTANTVSLAFGTTTANSWSALQTFNGGVSANTLTLGSLNGVLYGNNGAVASAATSSYAVGSEFSYSGTLGALVGGTGGSLTLATNGVALSKLLQVGANTILGNSTGATGNVTAFATSSLGIALSDTTGTLPVLRGGTGATTLNDLITLGTHTVGNYIATIVGTANQITVGGSGSESAAVTLSLPSQLNISNASTTNVSANTAAFGGTGTTTISSTGALTTPALTVGSLSGLLYGNSGVVGAASVSSPLSFTGGALSIGNAVSDGSTKGAASFTAADFNDSTGNISIDYTNGQKASGSQPGFLAAADFTTFNGKVSTTRAINTTYPLQGGGDLSADRTLTLAFGTTTANSWSALQTFNGGITTSGTVTLGTLNGLVGANNGILYQIASSTNFVTSLAAGTGIGISGSTGAVTITNNGLLSLAQTYGSAQTGAITIATSSAASNNGVTVGLNLTNSSGAFTFTPTVSVSNIPNAALQNSSVSYGGVTVALGASSAQPAFDLTNATNLPIIAGTTGTLSVARGGTGWSTIQSGTLLYGNAGGALATTTAGTNGQTLALLGGIPTWTATTTAGTGLTYSAGAFSVNTSQNISTLSNLTSNGLVKTSGGTGALSIATAGTDYQAPITLTTTGSSGAATFIGNTLNIPQYTGTTYTATYPITLTGSAFGIAFGTTTSNTWGGTQTFTNAPVLGTLTGLVGSNNGTLYQIATSSSFVTSVAAGTGIGVSGSTGAVTISNSGLLSLAQTYGSAQTGAISFATSSAAASNGVTVGLNVTNSSGAFTFTPTVSVSNIPNAALQNSTISSIALGGTLGALSATNSTLTFSGSYTGAAAQTIGLNLTNANVWTGLQSFANASSTLISNTGKAYFGGTATTTIDSAGNVVIPATATLTVGTATGLDYRNSGVVSTATVNSPLSFSAGTLSITNALADGSTKGASTYTAADFNDNGSGLVSLDYTNGQKATGSVPGFLAASDFTTFSGKENALTFAYPLTRSTNTISLAFGTTTSNTWGGTQTFTNAPVLSSLSGLLQGNGASAITAITGTAGQFPYFNGTNTVLATSTLFLASNSYVGVGTTTPKAPFHVDNNNVTYQAIFSGGTYLGNPTPGSGAIQFGIDAAQTATIQNFDANDNYFSIANTGGRLLISNSNSGISSITLNGGNINLSATKVGIGTSTPGSLLSLNGIANFGTATSTFYSTGGLNLTGGGCYAINGTCVGGSAYTGTYPVQVTGSVISLAFGTTTSNTWAGTQTFTNAPVLGTLTGLVGSNNGALYQIATSTNFVTSVAAGTGIGVSGATGAVTISNTGLLSLAQTYGSAQTGAITFATSSATSFNGLTVSHTITNTAGAFTFGTPTITGTLNNAGLTNSTISSIALGGTLGALSATNSTLTFSGSYTGAAAQTIGLNLGNANTWSALQQFNANASTTQLTVTGSTYLATAGGNVGIGTAAPTALLTVSKASAAVTREQLARFSVTDGGNDALYFNNGTVTDAKYSPSFAGYVDSGNTSPSIQFAGLTNSTNDASDSSSFGLVDVFAARTTSATDPFNGTLSDIANRKLFTVRTVNSTYLTVAATGNLGLGSTTPGTLLSLGDTGANTINISTTATSTFGSGINIRTGCFAVNGTCIGGSAYTGTYPVQVTGSVISLAFGTTTSNTWAGTQTFTNAPILTSLSGLLQGNGSSAITAVTGTAGQFPYYNGTNTLLATSTIFLATTGNVGIGSTTPSQLLSVGGNGYVTGGLGIGAVNSTAGTLVVTESNATTNTNTLASNITLTDTGNLTSQRTKRGQLITLTASGTYAALGSTNQLKALSATATFSGTQNSAGNGDELDLYGLEANGNFSGTASDATDVIKVAAAHFVVSGNPGTTANTSQYGALIDATGTSVNNYGIYVNQVSGATNGYGLYLAIVNGTNRYGVYEATNAANYFAGNVGIGSTTPGSLLSIGGSGTGTNFYDNATTTKNGVGGYNISSGCFAVAGVCVGGGGGGSGTVGSGTIGQFPYYAANGTTLTATSTLNLTASGKIGIGVTPGSSDPVFLVAGGGSFSGDITSTAGNVFAGNGTASLQSAGTVKSFVNGFAGAENFGVTGSFGDSGGLYFTDNSFGHATLGLTISSTDVISFTTVGTSKTVISTSLVGIGSTTPGSLLSIGNSGTNFYDNATTTKNGVGGYNIASGCFAVAGTCIGAGGGGSGTVGAGTIGQFPYYAANGTALAATSTIFLTTTGNVGIGSSTPYTNNKLSVAGDVMIATAGGGFFHFTGNTLQSLTNANQPADLTLTGNNVSLQTAAGTANLSGTGAVTVTSVTSTLTLSAGLSNILLTANNVGIGSTTPTTLLSVNGNAYLGSGAASKLTFHAGTINLPVSATTTIPNLTVNAFSIATSSTAIPMLSFDSAGGGVSGTLGVGSSTPWGKFSIEQGIVNPSFVVSNQGSSTPSFTVGGVNQNGYVGVGSSSPWGLLSVNPVAGNVITQPAFVIGSSTGTLFIVNRAGQVGIGTTSPTAGLEVKVASGVIARFASAAATGCAIATTGTISCTSDIRLKKNIAGISYGLNTLEALNPVAFNWNSENNTDPKSLGFIAQQVESVVPELVTTDTSTGYKQLNTIGLVPILTKSLQQLAGAYSIGNPGAASSTIASSYARTGSSAITVDSTGRVGIGTQAPQYQLDVNGTAAAKAFVATDLGGVSVPSSALTAGGVDLFKFATYNYSAITQLASRTDLAATRLDALEARVASLESQATNANSIIASSTASTTTTLPGLDVIQSGTSANVLSFLLGHKDSFATTTTSSVVYTGRLAAGLDVVSPSGIFDGLTVNSLGSIGGTLNVLADTVFIGRPYLNNDTAGFAVVHAGERTVTVTFDRPYVAQPVVSASVAIDDTNNGASAVDIAADYFRHDIAYVVVAKNVNGFTIVLNKAATDDVTFNWSAFAVKNPKIFESETVQPPQPDAQQGTSTPPDPGSGTSTPTPSGDTGTTPPPDTSGTPPDTNTPVTPPVTVPDVTPVTPPSVPDVPAAGDNSVPPAP